MACDGPAVLITGGDGYLGRRIAREYLARAEDDVILWVRARGGAELAAKRARLGRLLGEHAGRVRVAGGDLADDEPFATVETRSIRTIVHAAANTRFNVPRDVARNVNAGGTARLLAFARRCPGLERLALLGSVYSCGLRSGRIEETPHDGERDFANFYEWSKWEAERRLLGEFGDLPWRLLRVATVIADDESGTVGQHNAFHQTLRLVRHGLLPLLPGDPQTPLYFVTGAFVAAAVFALTEQTETRAIYHVAHGRAATCRLDEVVSIAFDAFESDASFRVRRVLRPLYGDWESFAELAAAVDAFGGPVVRQALGSVAPFARQLFSAKDVDNRNLAARLADYRPPDPRALIAATCASLLATRWGRPAPGGSTC